MALGPNKEMIEYLMQTGLENTLATDMKDSIRQFIKESTITNQYRKIEKKKQGRNELCACGSGIKYKRCCGK